MSDILSEIKVKIVETLDLVDLDPAAIEDEAILFDQSGLGLDSIDVLELVVMIEQDYGVKIDNKELGEKVFFSVKTLADYISEQTKA